MRGMILLALGGLLIWIGVSLGARGEGLRNPVHAGEPGGEVGLALAAAPGDPALETTPASTAEPGATAPGSGWAEEDPLGPAAKGWRDPREERAGNEPAPERPSPGGSDSTPVGSTGSPGGSNSA